MKRSYPPASAMASRVSAAEAQPEEDAPTALDRLRLTDDVLASWRDSRQSAPPVAPDATSARSTTPRRITVASLCTALALLATGAAIAGYALVMWLKAG